MAAGASVEPHGRELFLAHSCSPRISVKYGRKFRRFSISATDLPFSNNAPVGQTWTHLPQLVQVSDEPQGSFKSVTTCEPMPRPITSHTRTQRVQRMQRL